MSLENMKLNGRSYTKRDIEARVGRIEQVGGINVEEFERLNKSLQRLERFWTDQILYRL